MAVEKKQKIDYSALHPEFRVCSQRWMMAFDFLRGGRHIINPGRSIGNVKFRVDERISDTDPDPDREISRTPAQETVPWGSYLWKHETEREGDFAERCAHVFHFPLFAPIINEVAADLLRTRPERSESSADWQAFWSDVDDAGTDVDAFMRLLVCLGFCFGRMHVLTDGTAAGEVPPSRYHQERMGIRKYWQMVTPLRLINWAKDEHGRYLWVVIQEDLPDERAPGEQLKPNDAKAEKFQYRVWDRKKWELWRRPGKRSNEWKKEDEGEHGYDYVPIRDLFFTKAGSPSTMDCESPFASQLDLDQHLLNEVSENWTAERLYSFPVLAVPEMEGEAGAPIDIGPTKAFGYPAGQGIPAPSFISPDQAPMDRRWDRIKDKYLYGRMSAGVGRGMQERSIERRAADALVEELRAHLSQMAQWLSAIQEFDDQINGDIAAARKAKPPKATYSRSFYRTAILAAINVINQLSTTGVISSQLLVMMVKPVVMSFLSDQGMSADVLARAEAELQTAAELAAKGANDDKGDGDQDAEGELDEA